MQLGSKETENERFAHYFTKTYRKTASLIANSLKAVGTFIRLSSETLNFECLLIFASSWMF